MDYLIHWKHGAQLMGVSVMNDPQFIVAYNTLHSRYAGKTIYRTRLFSVTRHTNCTLLLKLAG